MSVLNLSGDESPECPLCMELLELDDINFYPCACAYQICRFCWNKLRTEGNGLCPACRQPYSENPADFKPLTSEEIAKIKAEKRQKDQAKKLKISENRKHLANVRVVQKNLVFVVGLSQRLADPEILKKLDYFGKFGKIHKVVINHSTQYAGSQVQGPSASAYVTYYKSEDALRAIQVVNNIFIDGRTLKASLGTTKYCSHFMKNQACPKNDCMYLHELGDEAASFTKEEMQQGKHTDYEKQLHDDMIAGLSQSSTEESSPTPLVSEKDKDRDMYGDTRNGLNMWPDPDNDELKGRINCTSSKEETSSKTKSCETSDDESGTALLSEDVLVQKATETYSATSDVKPLNSSRVLGEPDWSDAEVKINVFNNFQEEDDLGFDPFHETQKGLADLLESESKAAEAHQQQVMLGDSAWTSNHTMSRPRAPPPGFHSPSVQQYNFMPDATLNHIPGGVEALFNRAPSQLANRTGLSAPGFSPNLQNPQDLYIHAGKQATNEHDRVMYDHKPPQSAIINDGIGNKDWQDGLRALLPNVNVSFGSSNPQHSQQKQFGLQEWSGMASSGVAHDWTALDPAIVTGQLSHPERDMSRDLVPGNPRDLGFNRAESPSKWITANLEQLTNEPIQFNNQAGLIPAFNTMGLGGRNSHALNGQMGGWGSSVATPPPGFGQHRHSQLQHYPGFNMSKSTEAQKIGDF